MAWSFDYCIKSKSKSIIQNILTGHDIVRIRFLTNPIAIKLIEYSGVPIAASSSNKFYHISPVNPIIFLMNLKIPSENIKRWNYQILYGKYCHENM